MISSVVGSSPTYTVFVITFCASISSCVTVYVPVNVFVSPTAIVTVVSKLIISSFTAKSFNVTFPVFVTVIVYVTTSPAFTVFLSATFVTV